MDKIHVLWNKHKSVQSTHLVSLYVLFSKKYKQHDDSPGNSPLKFYSPARAYVRINHEKKKRKTPLRTSKLFKVIKIANTLQTSQKAKLLLLEGRTPFAKLTLLCSANKGLCKVSKANQFC